MFKTLEQLHLSKGQVWQYLYWTLWFSHLFSIHFLYIPFIWLFSHEWAFLWTLSDELCNFTDVCNLGIQYIKLAWESYWKFSNSKKGHIYTKIKWNSESNMLAVDQPIFTWVKIVTMVRLHQYKRDGSMNWRWELKVVLHNVFSASTDNNCDREPAINKSTSLSNTESNICPPMETNSTMIE